MKWLAAATIVWGVSFCLAADRYVSPTGRADAKGTKDSPWDLESTLAGRRGVAPGDTVWLAGGTYRHGDRKFGARGYAVRLAGRKGRPICVRAAVAQRVTIDGGLSVDRPSDHVCIRELEIVVSENFTRSRTISEPGSHPKSLARPWGGLNVYAGSGCKFVNLVIHDNAQGVSWWKSSTDSELYGCIIYDNGWKAPDRGHGHAIYTQNAETVKTISDCILTGGYGYTMHAYGSSRAYVDNYHIVGNIAYNGGLFLIGGGRPSRNITVVGNVLYGVSMRVGYNAPHNEDCRLRDNIIVNGGLSVVRYKKVERRDNLVLARGAARPAEKSARVILRVNKYDANRANVAIFNWPRSPKKTTVDVDPAALLQRGDRYRLMDPRDFYGKPLAAGTFEGGRIRVAVSGEFAAFVLLRTPRRPQRPAAPPAL